MAKVNVYLPDELEHAAREVGLSMSAVCQAALRDAVDRLAVLRATGDGRGVFTPRLREVIEASTENAAARGAPVGARDLLGGIMFHGENLGARALVMAGVDLPAQRPRGGSRARHGTGELTADAREALASAYKVALDMKHAHVGTEHVVIALADESSPLADLFATLGVTARGLRQTVEHLIARPWSTERTASEVSPELIERFDIEVQRLAAELDRLRGGTDD